jgi:hypothetical protein
MDFSMHPQEVQDIIAAYAGSSLFYLSYLFCLGIQAGGLWLISLRRKAGLVMAMIAGMIMLPLSLPYMLGALGSYYSGKFSSLTPAPPSLHGTRIFRPAIKKFLWGLCAAGTAISLALLSTRGSGHFPFLFAFSASLAAMHLALRGSRLSPLELSELFFIFCPHFLAARAAVPYAAVRSATLQDDAVLRLQIRTKDGEVTVHWSLATVSPGERDEALRTFGAALKAHGTSLY